MARSREKVRARDLSYSITSEGLLSISAMVDGYLERRRYGGYPKREATRMFLREMNDPKRETA